MSKFIVANGVSHVNSLLKFTKGKYYEVIHWEKEDYALVLDDNGKRCYVRVGEPTLRLASGGKFERVSDHLSNALAIAKNAEATAKSLCSNGTNPLAERLAKAEKDRDLYRQDCIKAEAVIDRLYDMFPQVRNHEQLVAAIKSAKIFSDAFLELQKIK